ncbi:phenylacetaldoxime dehydratase family protein [Alpinimonas psychrophila]
MLREEGSRPRRTIPARLPWPDWVPPVPGFSAKIDGPVTFAYYGVQTMEGKDSIGVAEFREWINATSALSSGPDYREYAEFVDSAGFYTWISIGYWRGDAQRFSDWSSGPKHQSFWESPARLTQTSGYFREVLQTPAERLETLYSDAAMCAGANGGTVPMSSPIQEHNYWGSMRDRIRASGNDALLSSSSASAARSTSTQERHGRVLISGKANLATIRSGEHYEGLIGREKEIYDRELVPSVVEGMLYLRDNPVESGCYSCRHMTETTHSGDTLERKFAVAHFVSLRHLEVWSESHPSHLKIFNRFIEMAQELKGAIKLRLWHEVLVTEAPAQYFEYLNCHEATGMLPYRESVFSSSSRS